MAETNGDLLASMGFDTALNMYDLDACVDRLADRVVLLTQERDALLADKARLDWLERQWREGVIAEICGTCDDVDRGLGRNWNLILDAITTQADTFRAAIDAATRTAEAPIDG